jgi:O-antigen/teichoic acid export membrane protein
VWKVSSWFAIGGLSLIFIERFDNIMTGLIISTKAITLLVITRKLFDIAKVFIFQLNNNYRPYFGKMWGEGKNEDVLSKFRNLSIISVVLASFAGGGIIIINDFFINIWVGEDKYGGLLLSTLLFFNLVFHAWKITYRAFLSSNLIAKELAISSFMEGGVNVGLAYVLGLKYGVEGIVASTFISGILIQGTALMLINSKYQFESIKVFLSRNIAQLILTLFLALAAYLISLFVELILLKIIIWMIVMAFSILIIHRIFFIEHSLISLLKGKVL